MEKMYITISTSTIEGKKEENKRMRRRRRRVHTN